LRPPFIEGRFMDLMFRPAAAVIAASERGMLKIWVRNFRRERRSPIEFVPHFGHFNPAYPQED